MTPRPPCAHCLQTPAFHGRGLKCLFDAKTYEPIDREQYEAFIRGSYKNRSAYITRYAYEIYLRDGYVWHHAVLAEGDGVWPLPWVAVPLNKSHTHMNYESGHGYTRFALSGIDKPAT